MKKLKLLLLLAFASLSISFDASALENKTINSEQDYFNTIAAINSSSETEFVVSLGSDIILTSYPSTSNPTTITNGKTVTFLGNGHKIKISETGSYGYNGILNVGNATVNLGNSTGADTLYIEGGGPAVSTSASLISISGVLNIYPGVNLGNNYSGNGGLTGGSLRLNNNAHVNMYGGYIHDNSLTAACFGGAVMIDGSNSVFNMYGGVFENNSACAAEDSYGGAILLLDYSETAVLNIEGGTFRNNSATYGGAVANLFGTMTIKNAIFENNSVAGPNNGDSGGGAIVNYTNKNSSIDNSIFIGNTARSAGAIYEYAGRLDVSNSVFRNNTATVDGGAVLIDTYGAYVSSGNVYENNTAENGGAIRNNKILYALSDTINDNTATNGGGIYAAGSRNTINSVVYNNKASTAANDIFIAAGASGISLKDPSTFNASSVFNGVSLEIDGWYKDEGDNRFSRINITDEIANDSITAGSDYYLTAANGTEFVLVQFAGDEISEADQYIQKGQKIAALPTPVREHYAFVGWYSDSELSTQFSTDTELNNNTTLFAKWQKEKHTITVDPAGGSYEGVAGNTTIEKAYGDNYSLTTPTKNGYRFVGWTVTSAEAYDPETSTITVGSSDVTAVAIWEEIPEDEIVVPSTSGDEEEDKKDDNKNKSDNSKKSSEKKDEKSDSIVVPNTASDDSTASTIPTIIAISFVVCFIGGLIYFKSKDKKIKL